MPFRIRVGRTNGENCHKRGQVGGMCDQSLKPLEASKMVTFELAISYSTFNSNLGLESGTLLKEAGLCCDLL